MLKFEDIVEAGETVVPVVETVMDAAEETGKTSIIVISKIVGLTILGVAGVAGITFGGVKLIQMKKEDTFWKKASSFDIDFWKVNSDKLDFTLPSSSNAVSVDFIREFKDDMDWTLLSKFHDFSEDEIMEFKDYVNWNIIKENQCISGDFVLQFEKMEEKSMLKFEDAVEIIEEGVDAAGPVGEIVETIGETKIRRGINFDSIPVGAVIGVVELVKSRSKKNDIDCDECCETNLVVCNECLEEAK